tara:strand:- start:10403 stop:11683 length:1281 start_codon:yes stop_codon:yes gene_type:complete
MPNSQLQRFEDTKVQFIDGDRGVDYPSKSELSKNGDCLFLNTGNVTSTGFVFDSIDFISFEKDQKLRKGKAAHEDIIMTTRGTVGNVAFFDPTLPFEHIRINSGMVIVRTDKNEYLPYFLYLFFRSELFRKQCLTNGSGSAQPQLPISALKNISIPKLSTKTQQTIIDVIQKLDKKIELNNKINTELEVMAKLIYDYWFVQFDFPDANGKPYKSSGGKMVYNEEIKREIPDDWSVKTLNELSNRIGDGIHGTPQYVDVSEFSFINGNNLKNGFIYTDNDTKKVSAKEYDKYFIKLDKNTILMSINGTLGNLAVFTDEKVMLGKSSAYINCLEGHRAFCYQYLKQSYIQKNFWNIATGSTIKNLSLKSLNDLKLSYPNVDLILKFNELINPLDGKRENIFKENKKLIELRNWLLPMLMNGQVTVKDA